MRLERIKSPRLTLHARVDGQGPRLLFIGGSNFDLALGHPVFDGPLPRHFTLAAADPRGLGRTGQPDGPWTMDDYAQDVVDLLDGLGWDDALVLGESFGGMIALHAAAVLGARIRRLAISVSAAGGAAGRSYPLHEIQALPDARARAEARLAIEDSRFERSEGTAREIAIADRIARETVFLDSANNRTGFPRLLEARATHDASGLLGAIAAPTLVLAGRFDALAPPPLSEAMVAGLPDARLSVHDAGHDLLTSTPAATEEVIVHFNEGDRP